MAEFTLLFHSINGDTIKDKNRNFNKFHKLLKSNMTNEEDMNNFIKSISPKTPVEDIFRIKIMIESKNKELLLDELKNCNVVFVRKLLRNWQLFRELFLNITATDLVNNVLPRLSYSLKLKILKGIRKNVNNEQLLDEYFDALEKRYGLKIATSILPGCSVNLIKSKTQEHHLKLSQSYLKGVFKKDKQFVEFYFDALKKKYENINFTYDYSSTLKYIAKLDPHIYWKLYDKYNLRIKFGKYMTPNMIKSHKNITEDAHVALEIFHKLKLYKTTQKEGILNSFLLSLGPETHYEFENQFLTCDILRFIQKGSISKQYHLISLFFSEKYKQNLLEYPSYFTEDLLKITPIKERESILDHKVQNNEALYYLYGTSISLPRFKKQLQHSSDSKTRSEYGRLLSKTCAVNRDDAALLDVLRYVLSRYRNDKSLLSNFFQDVLQYHNIIDLSDEHWQCISSINNILQLSPSQYWSTVRFFELYISRLLKYNKPIDDVIQKCVQDVAESRKYSFIRISNKNHHKEVCDEIAKCIDSYKNHDNYKRLCDKFLSFLNYELRCKDILDYIRFFDQLDENDWIFLQAIKAGLNRIDDRLHERFWKLNLNVDSQLVLWYAKHRPDLLRQNVQKLSTLIDMYNIDIFLRKFKKLCDTDVTEQIKSDALDNLRIENYSKAIFSFRALSILAPNDFLEMIVPLLPTSDGKIDLKETVPEKVNLQKEIAKGLSNIQVSTKSGPLILKFCNGDYLKFGLQPLYALTYNMPEVQVKDYLNKLSNTPVSVKKHLLLLSKDVFTKDDFYELLKEWSQKETNISMRNILLRKTVECFVESPSERIWFLLNSNLKSMDTNDRETYDFLLKFQKIPLQYLPKYLEIIYQSISSNSDAKIKEKKFQLINTIPTVIIGKLDEKFMKQLIRDAACTKQNTNFNWKCVFHGNENIRLVLLEENLAKLKHCVQENTTDLKQNARVRSKVSRFLLDFVNLAIQLKEGLDFVQKIITAWTSIFQTENFTKEYMLIRFTELYFISEFDAYQTGVKINELLYEYINKYNSGIIDYFCTQVCKFLLLTSLEENKELFKFVNGVFQERKDENIYIAVIYLLPKTLPKIDNVHAEYIPIIKAIEDFDSPVVKYHFDNYLTDK